MRVSELINKLAELMQEEGNLEVKLYCDEYDVYFKFNSVKLTSDEDSTFIGLKDTL